MQSFPLEKEHICAVLADETPGHLHHQGMIQYHLNPILAQLPFRIAKSNRPRKISEGFF